MSHRVRPRLDTRRPLITARKWRTSNGRTKSCAVASLSSKEDCVAVEHRQPATHPAIQKVQALRVRPRLVETKANPWTLTKIPFMSEWGRAQEAWVLAEDISAGILMVGVWSSGTLMSEQWLEPSLTLRYRLLYAWAV